MPAQLIIPLAASASDLDLLLMVLVPVLGFLALAWLTILSERRGRKRFRELNYDDEGNPTTAKGRIIARLGLVANFIVIWIVTVVALIHVFGPSFSSLEKIATVGVPTALSVAFFAVSYSRKS